MSNESQTLQNALIIVVNEKLIKRNKIKHEIFDHHFAFVKIMHLKIKDAEFLQYFTIYMHSAGIKYFYMSNTYSDSCFTLYTIYIKRFSLNCIVFKYCLLRFIND